MSTKEKTNSNKNMAGMIIVAALLFAAGFFIGSLYQENQQLKKGVTVAADLGEQALPPPSEDLTKLMPVNESDWVIGDPDNAKIVLYEYSDLNCIWCKRFHPVMKQLLSDYDGEIAWVYRHLPFQNSAKQSELAECVADQMGADGFWKFVDAYYEKISTTENAANQEAWLDLAVGLGAKRADLKSCLESGKFTEKVAQIQSSAQGMGITGTPATVIVVDGEPKALIPGAIGANQMGTVVKADMQRLIDLLTPYLQ